MTSAGRGGGQATVRGADGSGPPRRTPAHAAPRQQPSRSRRLLGLVALVVAAPPAALTLLAFLGRRLWVGDLAASLRPQYALLLAVAAVLLLVARRGWSALVITGLAVVNAVAVAPLWLGGPAEPAAESPTLRVLFHNVHGGGDRFDDIAAAVEAADVDVAFFADAPRDWGERFVDEGGPYDFVFPPDRAGHRGNVAISRVPVDDAQHLVLAWESRVRSLVLDVPLGSRDVRMLVTHTLSPRTPRRAADRNLILSRAADWARDQTGPALVVGDLNATPWSHAFRALLRDGGLLDSKRGFGLQPTYPVGAGPFMIPIDHLLHSEELTVVSRTTGPSLGSGHRSIIVELALTDRR